MCVVFFFYRFVPVELESIPQRVAAIHWTHAWFDSIQEFYRNFVKRRKRTPFIEKKKSKIESTVWWWYHMDDATTHGLPETIQNIHNPCVGIIPFTPADRLLSHAYIRVWGYSCVARVCMRAHACFSLCTGHGAQAHVRNYTKWNKCNLLCANCRRVSTTTFIIALAFFRRRHRYRRRRRRCRPKDVSYPLFISTQYYAAQFSSSTLFSSSPCHPPLSLPISRSPSAVLRNSKAKIRKFNVLLCVQLVQPQVDLLPISISLRALLAYTQYVWWWR